MSDSEDSTVTYTEVSSLFEDLSDIGSPRVIIYEYNGLPMMPKDPYAYIEAALQAPPSPDYVPVPEELKQASASPDFVPEPVYPEFMPHEDNVLPAEEQPLPATISPTIVSPADYPIDRDDDEEEDEEESSGDDVDDEEEDEDEDEEEEEQLAPADSVPPPVFLSLPLPISPPLLLASPTHLMGYRAAMIRLRAESPSTSHLLPLPLPIVLLHTRESMAMMRVATPSTYILAYRSETPPSGTPPLLPIPLPTSLPPFLVPSIDYKADVLEVTLPPWKRLCIALGPRYEVRESPSAPTTRPTEGFRVDYGFVGTLDVEIRCNPDREIGYGIIDISEDPYKIIEEILVTDVAKLGQRMTNFVMTVRQDTDENYRRLDDAQDDRSLMSG
ncbi:hypothetical protein Tco_0341235 [Tanacetum coccineum]